MDNSSEAPIKVLILDTVMDRGGAETMTMNYFRNMDRTKVSYDFLVHREYKAAYEDEIEKLGGKIYRICPPYPQNYFRYTRDIRKLFKEHPEYKIIHCNMMELGLLAYREAKRCHVPVRICHAHTAPGKERLTLKGMIRGAYKKCMKPYVTHKFACGKAAAEWVFGKNSIDDVIYMKNAVDVDLFRYNESVERNVRSEFHIENKYVVGHVGRFFEPKNHPFIIDIFAEVSKRNLNAVLMLVGGGELDDACMNATKEKVKRLGLEEKVIFTGVREDVHRLLQAFDVFILPSLCEGFPVVLVEAQAAGLRCVVSDRVTEECNIVSSVDYIPLEAGAVKWAEHILRISYQKQDTKSQIINAGYDIHTNAAWLQNFYLSTIIH